MNVSKIDEVGELPLGFECELMPRPKLTREELMLRFAEEAKEEGFNVRVRKRSGRMQVRIEGAL